MGKIRSVLKSLQKSGQKRRFLQCFPFQDENMSCDLNEQGCKMSSKSEPKINPGTRIDGWKLPVFVTNPEKSKALTKFREIKLPDFSQKQTLDVFAASKSGKFQFPMFPEGHGNHLEREDQRSDSIFYSEPRMVTHIGR